LVAYTEKSGTVEFDDKFVKYLMKMRRRRSLRGGG